MIVERFYYIRRGFVDSLITRGWSKSCEVIKNKIVKNPTILLECTIMSQRGYDKRLIGYMTEYSYGDYVRTGENFEIVGQDGIARFHNSCKNYAMSFVGELLEGGFVDVFRKAGRDGDFSNKGISSKHSTLFLAGVKPYKQFPVTGSDLNICLVPVYTGPNTVGLFPLKTLLKGNRPMFGGNFAYSTDNGFFRFSAYPLPIHDRIE